MLYVRIVSAFLVCLLLLPARPAGLSGAQPMYPEVHCKHFFFGYPKGTPETNDLIIRDIYALSSNDETKFADWVAFRLTPQEVVGAETLRRVWEKDPWLEDGETLYPADFEGLSAIKCDRGHQAPLASFKGTREWQDTNYMSNITPQHAALNEGAWKTLEEEERRLVEGGNILYVMTGPVYKRGGGKERLPHCRKAYRIPDGYWRILGFYYDPECESDIPAVTALSADEAGGSASQRILLAAFFFPQDTPRDAKFWDYFCRVDDIEKMTGLDFLNELPEDDQAKIEGVDDHQWLMDALYSPAEPGPAGVTARARTDSGAKLALGGSSAHPAGLALAARRAALHS